MVIIDCGTTLVDAPYMYEYWTRSNVLCADLTRIQDIWYWNRSEWDYECYLNGFHVWAAITRFRNRIRSIQSNLMSRMYVTRLTAHTLRNCNELLGFVEQMHGDITDIVLDSTYENQNS